MWSSGCGGLCGGLHPCCKNCPPAPLPPLGLGRGTLDLFFRADSKNLGATAPFWVAMADFFTFCQAARCSSPHKVPKKLAALIATPPHAQCRPPTFGHHHLCQPARPIGPSLPMGNNLTLHQTTRFTTSHALWKIHSFSEVGRVPLGWHGQVWAQAISGLEPPQPPHFLNNHMGPACHVKGTWVNFHLGFSNLKKKISNSQPNSGVATPHVWKRTQKCPPSQGATLCGLVAPRHPVGPTHPNGPKCTLEWPLGLHTLQALEQSPNLVTIFSKFGRCRCRRRRRRRCAFPIWKHAIMLCGSTADRPQEASIDHYDCVKLHECGTKCHTHVMWSTWPIVCRVVGQCCTASTCCFLNWKLFGS